MSLYRTIQVCNRAGRAHIWVCPWLRDNPTDYFDEWVIRLAGTTNMQQGQHFFVDLDRETKFVAFNLCGAYNWVPIPKQLVIDIERPQEEDFRHLRCWNVINFHSTFTG